jgi:hypothetical protein
MSAMCIKRCCTPELLSAVELAKFYQFTDYLKLLAQAVALTHKFAASTGQRIIGISKGQKADSRRL